MIMVELRTGKTVPKVLVHTVAMTLERLMNSENMGEILAVIDAAEIARNPSVEIFSDSRRRLTEFGILDANGRMNDVTRQVIKAMTEGEGMSVALVSPYMASRQA